MDFMGNRVWGVGSLGVDMDGFYGAAAYVASQSACGLRVLFYGVQGMLTYHQRIARILEGKGYNPLESNR